MPMCYIPLVGSTVAGDVVERAVEGKPGVDVSYEGKPGDEVDGVVAIVERSVVGKPGVDVS